MTAKAIPCVISLLLCATPVANGQTPVPPVPQGGFTNSMGIVLSPIPAGSFRMGQAERQTSYRNPWSLEKDTGADWDEAPVRQVTITRPFYMGVTEVTNAQYERFDPSHRARRPSRTESSDDDAVVNVSWDDATRFCQWLSKQEGKPYRLPTEAEWEYACRAGTTTRYYTGDSLPDGYQSLGYVEALSQFFPPKNAATTTKIDVAVQNQNSAAAPNAPLLPPYYNATKKVSLLTGRSPANAWGLQGMHGNAEEWCLDWYAPYDPAFTTDPVGPAKGEFRVVRGGANGQLARLLRSANRLSMDPWARNRLIGFRIVSADPPAPATADPLPVPPISVPPLPAPKNEAVDMKIPYFTGPHRYVNVPPGSEGPLFSAHNHDPAIAVLSNGDVLILHYSCDTEFGHELAVGATRLRAGTAEFTPPELFYQCADANNHAPALYVNTDGTVFHFNGNRALPGSVVRISADNGRTWSPGRPHNDDFQPNESTIRTTDGRIVATADSRYDNAGTVTVSSDNGMTWTKLSDETTRPVYAPGGTGSCIAGIHVGLIERKDGSLWALGRVDNQAVAAMFDFKLPISISTDGGKTWTYSISEFPDITSGQRLTLKRLKEGPLLLCTFTDDLARRDSSGRVTGPKSEAECKGQPFPRPDGTTKTGYGLIAALSYDDGATWPVRRLVTPVALGESAIRAEATDGRVLTLDSSHAELTGYLASSQGADGRIHLISSRNYYVFNLAWLTQAGTATIPK